MPGSNIGNFGVFNNTGTFSVQSSNGSNPFVDCVFNNSGTVALQTGTHYFSVLRGGYGNGAFIVPSQTILNFTNISSPRTYTMMSGAAITGSGTTMIDGATLDINGDTTINTGVVGGITNGVGTINVQSGATLTLTGAFSSGGMTQLSGGTITSVQPLHFGGTLTGFGTINGNIINSATISPGASVGMLAINGNVSLLNYSRIVMEIGGLTQGTEENYLDVNGATELHGILEFTHDQWLSIEDQSEGELYHP